MATQNNIAVSQPQYTTENASITLVSEKDKKKQQQEAAHLIAVLQTIEEQLASAKAGANVQVQKDGKVVPLEQPANANDDNSGPPVSPYAKAMAEMVEALQNLQLNIVKYGQEKSTMDASNSKLQAELAAANLQSTIEQIQKIENMSFWEKIAEWFVAVVSFIAAIITENPALLVITVLSVLAATGALSKITDLVADVIQDMGASKEVANLVASILVTIVVIVCSFGMGALAAPEAVAEGASEVAAEEVTEEAASEAAQAATDAASDGASSTTSVGQKALGLAKRVLNFLNFFSKLSTSTNTAILGGLQAVSATGLFNNMVEASNLSDAEKQKIEEILSIVVAVIAVVGSVGASTGALGNAMENITNTLAKNSRMLFNIFAAAEAGGGLSQGSFQVAQGVFEKFLADCKADFELISVDSQMITQQTGDDQRFLVSNMKNQGTGNRDISKLMDGERAYAQMLNHSSV